MRATLGVLVVLGLLCLVTAKAHDDETKGLKKTRSSDHELNNRIGHGGDHHRRDHFLGEELQELHDDVHKNQHSVRPTHKAGALVHDMKKELSLQHVTEHNLKKELSLQHATEHNLKKELSLQHVTEHNLKKELSLQHVTEHNLDKKSEDKSENVSKERTVESPTPKHLVTNQVPKGGAGPHLLTNRTPQVSPKPEIESQTLGKSGSQSQPVKGQPKPQLDNTGNNSTKDDIPMESERLIHITPRPLKPHKQLKEKKIKAIKNNREKANKNLMTKSHRTDQAVNDSPVISNLHNNSTKSPHKSPKKYIAKKHGWKKSLRKDKGKERNNDKLNQKRERREKRNKALHHALTNRK